MNQEFANVYNDETRARAYDRLEFPGTYYLAFRDIPAILGKHVRGTRALDFGCGTGRSTRFLKKLGFDAIGVDIAEQMLRLARERDPLGEYHLAQDGDLTLFDPGSFDLVLSAFTFDNIPTLEGKVSLFRSLGQLINPDGCIVNLVSSPEIYLNEWVSFSTKAFPENRSARSGQKVSIVMLDVEDSRPVQDILWTHRDYLTTYELAGLVATEIHKPLATAAEPYAWVSETAIAPWVIYVLGKDENNIR